MNIDFVVLSRKLYFSCTLEGKSPGLKWLQETSAVPLVCIDYGRALSPGLKPSSLAWEMAAKETHRRMCECTLTVNLFSCCLTIVHSAFTHKAVSVWRKDQLAREGKSSPAWRLKCFLGACQLQASWQGCPLILDFGAQRDISFPASEAALLMSRC